MSSTRYHRSNSDHEGGVGKIELDEEEEDDSRFPVIKIQPE